MLGALRAETGTTGITEASAMRSPSTPRTRRRSSTTLRSSVPIEQVPAKWKVVIAFARMKPSISLGVAAQRPGNSARAPHSRSAGAPGNLDADIARLNRIRRAEPALQTLTNLSFHPSGHPDVLFYVKGAWARDLLCAVTVNPREAVTAALELPLPQLGLPLDAEIEVEDLLSGERCRWRGARQDVRFDPTERVGYIWRVIRDGGGVG